MKILMPKGEKHIVIMELQTSEEELKKNGWKLVKSNKDNHRFYVRLIHGIKQYIEVDDNYLIISTSGICWGNEIPEYKIKKLEEEE